MLWSGRRFSFFVVFLFLPSPERKSKGASAATNLVGKAERDAGGWRKAGGEVEGGVKWWWGVGGVQASG